MLKNATIRENVCFGRPFEEEKYWKAIKDSCLEPDLAMLPNGDLTEVGERVSHESCEVIANLTFSVGNFVVWRSEATNQRLSRSVL